MPDVLPANSVGIWAFGPSVTRFVPAGYHPKAGGESMVEKTERVAHSLADRQALAAARERADAIAGMRAVYATLGLDKDYEAEVIGRRQARREAAELKARG